MKETTKVAIKITCSFIVSMLFVGGCSYLNKTFNVKDDSIIEEVLESIIEKEIGISIDLTPDSIES